MDESARARQDEARRRAAETKKARSRAALIEAGIAMGGGSFKALTVQGISKQADMSVPGFYKHFPNIRYFAAEVLTAEVGLTDYSDRIQEVDEIAFREWLRRQQQAILDAVTRYPSLTMKAGVGGLRRAIEYNLVGRDSEDDRRYYKDHVRINREVKASVAGILEMLDMMLDRSDPPELTAWAINFMDFDLVHVVDSVIQNFIEPYRIFSATPSIESE